MTYLLFGWLITCKVSITCLYLVKNGGIIITTYIFYYKCSGLIFLEKKESPPNTSISTKENVSLTSGEESSRTESPAAELSGVESSGTKCPGAELSRAEPSRTELSRVEQSRTESPMTDLCRVESSGMKYSGTDSSSEDLPHIPLNQSLYKPIQL